MNELEQIKPDENGMYDQYGNRYLTLTIEDYNKALRTIRNFKLMEFIHLMGLR